MPWDSPTIILNTNLDDKRRYLNNFTGVKNTIDRIQFIAWKYSISGYLRVKYCRHSDKEKSIHACVLEEDNIRKENDTLAGML